jgi:osmotically inducible lipoprotein OsmB
MTLWRLCQRVCASAYLRGFAAAQTHAWLLFSQCASTSEFIMKTNAIQILACALLAFSLAACSGMSGRDKNTAAGAVIGGAAGSILTGGSTAGAVGGAAVGGVIGNQVDPNKK